MSLEKRCLECKHFDPSRSACVRCRRPVRITRPEAGACLYYSPVVPESTENTQEGSGGKGDDR